MKTDRSFRPTSPPLLPSACALRAQTATWRRCSSALTKSPQWRKSNEKWAAFSGPAQELKLPSAPKQFLHYFEEADRPQTKLDRNLENGMAVSIGRLRPDTQYDYKFVCLSHNTLRGAAGGAVLLAELLAAEGYMG